MTTATCQASLDQNLIPQDLTKTHFNLSIPFNTFGAIPFEECESVLDAEGLKKSPYNLVLYRLFGFLDWSKTVRIGVHDFMSGWTCVFSEATLAEKLGCDVKTVRKALHALVNAKILKREKCGKCFRYRIVLFDAVLEYLKAHPPETVKVAYLKHKESLENITEFKHTTRNNKEKMSANNSAKTRHNSVNFPDSQDLKKEELKPRTPTPGPRFRAQAAPTVPSVGEGEEGNLEISETPNPEPPAPAIPTGNPEDDRMEEKASPREKDADFFLSSSFSLADKFAGDDLEFTPPDLRRKHAAQFRDQLRKMFRSPALVDRYPDEGVRLARCTEALRIWIEIVQDRDKPAVQRGLSFDGGGHACAYPSQEASDGGVCGLSRD